MVVAMRSFLPSVITAVLLAACSPAQYKINPPAPEKAEESIPETQQEDYMRIVSDLRWDQLTSREEWFKRFPGCFKSFKTRFEYDKYIYLRDRDIRCSDFAPGGIPVKITFVSFASNSGTSSKMMTRDFYIDFWEDSQSRAFKAALAEKYSYTTEGYCSKYTCWDLKEVDSEGGIIVTPTPYTVSLLDQVKIDPSDL